MKMDKVEARFESGYRVKAFFFFLQWLSWSNDDYSTQRAIWQWVYFWHRQATGQREKLDGYEWQKFQEWRENEERPRDERGRFRKQDVI